MDLAFHHFGAWVYTSASGDSQLQMIGRQCGLLPTNTLSPLILFGQISITCTNTKISESIQEGTMSKTCTQLLTCKQIKESIGFLS